MEEAQGVFGVNALWRYLMVHKGTVRFDSAGGGARGAGAGGYGIQSPFAVGRRR